MAGDLGGSNDDVGLAIAVDSSGNVCVTGYTKSFGAGDEDVFILKLNSTGDIVWQKTWGGSGGDRGLGITVDSSGNIYVTGWTLSYGTSSQQSGWNTITYSAVFLLKLNSTGDLEWQRTWEELYAAQCGDCLATDSSGNVYVAGYYGGFILKFNSTGSLMWQKTWGSTTWGNDQCYGLARDASGNLYITGQTTDFGAGNQDAFVLELSPAGGLVWQKTWGGSGDDEARGIAINSTYGQIYVTGFTNSFGAGNYSVFLLTLNFTGGLEQQKIISGGGYDEGFGIALSTSGDPVVTGYVSEAPPYNVNSSSFVLGSPNFSLATSSISTTSPSAALGVPSGTVSTPSGSSTYNGNTDVLLLMLSGMQPYNVTFTATGLASEATWWVDLSGDNQSSTSNVISFKEWNGTYAYSIGAFGYNASDSTGSVTVEGADVDKQVAFTIVPEFPSFLALPLFIIATLLAAVVCRRKHSSLSTR